MIARRALLLGTPLLVAARVRPVLATLPISRLALPWWRQRFEAKQAELHSRPVELVFYGDSITANWEKTGPQPWQDFAPVWQRYYGDRHAINLGFKGDTTASLIWRLQNGEAQGIAPKAAVVLIGANNFGHVHWGAQETLHGIDAVVSEIRQRLPGTKILLLAVLPSERSAWISEQTAAVNRALPGRYGPMVTVMDLGHLFYRDGRLDRSMFLDPLLTPPDPPLHPTAQAQAAMAAAMEPTLAHLLGDRMHG